MFTLRKILINYVAVVIASCIFIGMNADNASGQGSIRVPVPNGTRYQNNGNFITTPFCFGQNYTANFVIIDCLDDRNHPNTEPATETFEVAITTDAAGNNVLTRAQLTNDFGCTFGNCDKHMYLFDFCDVALTGGTWYYLRTKVIAGAPVALWGATRLYYDNGLPVGNRINVGVPNGSYYGSNGSSTRTAFSLSQNATARYVMLGCLDDRNHPDTEPATETFEVAITTDAAGNNVIGSAQQITRDFGCTFGNCDKRMHLFDIGDVALTGGVTYYLRCKVLAGAPVQQWGWSFLYYWPTANYRKFASPPDVDKAFTANNNSCWLATAANMLAGAGYGTGNTMQARANNIYNQLTAHYGTANGGWTDTALTWWLGSAHNIWPANPYDVVTVHGNKTKTPWANANGAAFIGNELRRCEKVGLSISWPRTTANGSPYGGHAITCWGDSSGGAHLAANPTSVTVCDSDRDTGGNIQTYTYDGYANPNPGRFNEGNGWYINYSNNHPFIKHIITLCPTRGGCPPDGDSSSRTNSSYKIHQTLQAQDGTALHYQVGSYHNILDYETTIDWQTPEAPIIAADGPPAQNLTVDWDLTANPVPYCRWICINTQFVLPDSGSIRYRNVELAPGITYPGFDLEIHTAAVAQPDEPNITGGYVIGAFDLIDYHTGTVVGEHRFLHQYQFDQDPELHYFSLQGDPAMTEPYAAANFRFGHAYGYFDPEMLWEFEDWMTRISDPRPLGAGHPPINIELNWAGRLPYPEGEIIPTELEEPECTEYLPQDLNRDCYVNFGDFAEFAGAWLESSVPAAPHLVGHWSFEEGQGTTAADTGTGSNDGTLMGDPQWVPGRVGSYALDFDGDDYVKTQDITNELDFAPGSFSASAWINARQPTGEYRAVLDYDKSGDNWFTIFLHPAGGFHFRVGRDYKNSEQILDPNEWYLLTGTYDAAHRLMSLYINGQFDCSRTQSQGFSAPRRSKLTIGVNGAENDEFFDGMIDDIRIYNVALSAEEVQALYGGCCK